MDTGYVSAASARCNGQGRSKLLAQPELVDMLPVLSQFAVSDPVNCNPTHFNDLAGRRNSHVLATMGTLSSRTSDDLIVFGDDIIDRHSPVRKGEIASHSSGLETLDADPPWMTTDVLDEIVRNQLIDCRQILFR